MSTVLEKIEQDAVQAVVDLENTLIEIKYLMRFSQISRADRQKLEKLCYKVQKETVPIIAYSLIVRG